MFRYKGSSLNENKKFFDEYLNSLSGRYDNFLEEHILKSDTYTIYMEKIPIGYFSIFENEMLTQFFVTTQYFKYAQPSFGDVLQKYKVKTAFVPTCDETFLSLCLDKHCKVNLQAYFFEESKQPVRPAEFSREFFHVAVIDDLEEIKQITGDFTDNHEERIKAGELFVLREKGEFLGLGIIEDNKIMKKCQATGMYTNEKHRQRGVGRSIILHLKDICQERGITALPGCWYYNDNSKRTLESCGYISKTRLLKVDFAD